MLVVDDNLAVQDVLSGVLSSLGSDVTLAGNGIEAETLFVTRSYDLVVTDLQMPQMNGWELCRCIKEQSPKTPVIVVTGFCDDEHWEEMNMSFIDAILVKPFQLEEFEKTVERPLKSG